MKVLSIQLKQLLYLKILLLFIVYRTPFSETRNIRFSSISNNETILEQWKNPANLITPNENTVYFIGDTLTILWSSLDSTLFNDCNINISVNNGKDWHTITSEKSITIENETWGKYTWKIPEKLWISGKLISSVSNICKIKINQYGNNSIFDISNSLFSIQKTTKTKNNESKSLNSLLFNIKYSKYSSAIHLLREGNYSIKILCLNGSQLTVDKIIGPCHLELSRFFTTTGYRIVQIQFENKIINHTKILSF